MEIDNNFLTDLELDSKSSSDIMLISFNLVKVIRIDDEEISFKSIKRLIYKLLMDELYNRLCEVEL